MSPNRYKGSTSGPMFYEDGVGYAGKGRFFLPLLGTDKNPKEVTLRLVLGAIAVVLIILLVASLLAGKQPKNIPYEMEMLLSIGEPLESVALKIGVKPENMTETKPGTYFSSCGFPIDGVTYDLYFYVEEGKVAGFDYRAEYQADAKKAAKDIYNGLVNLGIEKFVPYGETEPVTVTRRNLQTELNKEKVFLVKYTTDLTPTDANDPMRVYMDALEAADDWEGRVGEYVTRKAVLYRDEGASYDPETQKVQLILSYRIEPERGLKYD